MVLTALLANKGWWATWLNKFRRTGEEEAVAVKRWGFSLGIYVSAMFCNPGTNCARIMVASMKNRSVAHLCFQILKSIKNWRQLTHTLNHLCLTCCSWYNVMNSITKTDKIKLELNKLRSLFGELDTYQSTWKVSATKSQMSTTYGIFVQVQQHYCRTIIMSLSLNKKNNFGK